jgi:hypothetical protein
MRTDDLKEFERQPDVVRAVDRLRGASDAGLSPEAERQARAAMHASFDAVRDGRASRRVRATDRPVASRAFPRRRVPILVLVVLAAILVAYGLTAAYPRYLRPFPTPTPTPLPFGTNVLLHKTATFTDVMGKERSIDVTYLRGPYWRFGDGLVFGPVTEGSVTYAYRISGGTATQLQKTPKELEFTDSEGKVESLSVSVITEGERVLSVFEEMSTGVDATPDPDLFLVSGSDGYAYLLDVRTWSISLFLTDRDGHLAADILAKAKAYRTAHPKGSFVWLAGLTAPMPGDGTVGSKWIYWSNWRLGYEDGPGSDAGEFRVYDPATKKDFLLSGASGAPFVFGLNAEGKIVYMPAMGTGLDLVELDPATGSQRTIATLSRSLIDFVSFGIHGNRLQVVPMDKKGIWEVDLSTGVQGWMPGTEGRLVTNVSPDPAGTDATLFSIQADDSEKPAYRLVLYRKGEALRYFDPPEGKVAGAGWLDAETATILIQAPNGKNAETWIVPLSEFK